MPRLRQPERRRHRVFTHSALALTVGMISTSPLRPTLAEHAPDQQRSVDVGRVVGRVFDSLTMKPLSGASVWIAGTPLASTSDAAGKFILDSVPVGRQVVTFSTPQLDSAGLSELGAAVEVKSGSDAHLKLASPSLRTLWKFMCARDSEMVQDSGIVYGIVSDGENHTRLVKAPTAFSWVGMNVRLKKFDFVPSTKIATSDSTGAYYACGLPSGTALNIRAYGNKAASGEIEHVLGVNRVARIDITVTTDLASVDNTHGRGTVRGYVVDAKDSPVADAVVSIASSDTTVRTDSAGLFLLQHVPSGTQSLQVRKIGLESAGQTIDLIPERITEARVRMSKATVLATVNVRDKASISVYHDEYLERRKLGLGTAVEFDKHNFPDLISPLLTNARVSVRTNGTTNERLLVMKMGLSDCTPRLYLDGAMVSEEMIANMPSELIRVVEIFASFANLPARFMGNAMGGNMTGAASSSSSRAKVVTPPSIVQRAKAPPCGAIAWWTKAAFPE